MDADFWHQRWAKQETGFHEGQPNALLVRHANRLALQAGQRVFLPLCGKTRDIAWFLAQGLNVAGAELSELAIQQLFAELKIQPRLTPAGSLLRYHASGIDMFVGDIFAMSADQLGPVDAIYDRAALVALPEAMRDRYTAHLRQITRNAQQLLITFEYDQRLQPGPPFCISCDEVQHHYAQHYQPELLESIAVPGGLKGQCAASESVWHLHPTSTPHSNHS